MDKEKIIENANRLLKKYNIDDFKDEVHTFELLNRIVKGNVDETVNENTIKDIEIYLDSKIMTKNIYRDYQFLSELADDLELQKIRKSDYDDFKVVIFKVQDINNNEYTFLTRKYLKKYVKLHNNIFNNPTIMELEFHGNPELSRLLTVIKKMFRTTNYSKDKFNSKEIDKLIIESDRRQERYYNLPVVDVMHELTQNSINIINKLGIQLENKIYTEYEFDILEMKIRDYYIYEDMPENEMFYVKSLKGTGITNNDLKDVLYEISEISFNHNF